MPIIVSNSVSTIQRGNGDDVLPPGVERADDGLTQDHLDFPYLVQQLVVDYYGDEGLLQVAVGAPFVSGGEKVPCKIVRTHAPIMRKLVTYNYVRIGVIPVVPPPETDDPNLVLLEHRRLFWGSWQEGTAIPRYARSGEYEYAMRVPLTTNDVMPFGRNPAFEAGTVTEESGSSDYDSTLLAR